MDTVQSSHISSLPDSPKTNNHKRALILHSLKNAVAKLANEYSIGISEHNGLFSWVVLDLSSNNSPYAVSWGIDGDKMSLRDSLETLGLHEALKSGYISTYLQASKTLFRKIALPITISPKDRHLALLDAIERTSAPSSISGTNIDETAIAYRIEQETDEELFYNTFITSKKSVHEIKEATDSAWHTTLSQVEKVFPKGACLEAWAQKSLDLTYPTLLIDVGAFETTILFFLEHKLEIHRCIPIGLDAFSHLQLNKQPSDSQGIEENVFIDPSLQTLLKSLLEIKEAALIKIGNLSHSRHTDQGMLGNPFLCLTGPIVCSPIYPKIIAQFLELSDAIREDIPPHPLLGADASEKEAFRMPLHSLATELGAALLGNEKSFFSSNKEAIPEFELPEIASSYLFLRHAKSSLYCLFLTSILLSLFCIGWSRFQEKKILTQYREEINSLNEYLVGQPLFSKEQSLTREIQERGSLENEGRDFSHTDSLLEQLKDELKKKSTFSLQPTTPLFSETLIALNQLAKEISITQDDTQKHSTVENESSQILLTSCKYSMIKRPDIKRPKEKYQVRVDIEFTAPSQAIARKFYDALLQSKQLVDKESEVKWTVAQGKYRASFFLKTRASLRTLTLGGTHG